MWCLAGNSTSLFPKKPKPLYSAADLSSLAILQSYLADHGIVTQLVNTYLSGAAGELPVFECWPKLMLVDEDLRQYATQLIKEFNKPLAAELTTWECPHCHELVNAELAVCWNCGASEGRDKG